MSDSDVGTLRELTALLGVAGYEDTVIARMRDEFSALAHDVEVDPLGTWSRTSRRRFPMLPVWSSSPTWTKWASSSERSSRTASYAWNASEACPKRACPVRRSSRQDRRRLPPRGDGPEGPSPHAARGEVPRRADPDGLCRLRLLVQG